MYERLAAEAGAAASSFPALIISICSFATALTALGWQIAKHFLDGGRVKVYLNVAIWEPGFSIVVKSSGRLSFKNEDAAREVIRGNAFELGQLVVENPGRVPVTIYGPSLSFSGHGKKGHTVGPRLITAGDGFGANAATKDSVVRLEPYGRVTFLFDFWALMPGIFENASSDHVFVRGHIGVAGRTKRPQQSGWRRRWRVERGMYTAIDGSPPFTPFSVLWRSMYFRLPESAEDNPHRSPEAGRAITRGDATFLLDEAMSRFDHRPDLDAMVIAVDELAKKRGDRFPAIGSSVMWGYIALDRMDGHLTEWTEGLFHKSPSPSSAKPEGEQGDDTDQ